MMVPTEMPKQQIVDVLNKLIGNTESLLAEMHDLKAMIEPPVATQDDEHLDPADPANKLSNGKFSERGIEVCFRLFDKGYNKNMVAREMGISYAAAIYRHNDWINSGGSLRKKQPLE